jgi:peptidoglycan/xylan/chitin deacetylase (PgdA/CDA1 family)
MSRTTQENDHGVVIAPNVSPNYDTSSWEPNRSVNEPRYREPKQEGEKKLSRAAFGLILIIALLLTGCGSGSKSSQDPPPPPPPPPQSQNFVSITFDDGYQSTYDNGLPIFDKVGMKYTWYIISAFPDTDPFFATWAEVLDVSKRPNAEIGNHTQTHNGVTQPDGTIKFLTMLDAADLESETFGAQQDFIAKGITPTTLAYPYGDYDMTPGNTWPPLPFSQQTVEQAVKKAGLMGARTTDFCLPNPSTPPDCGYVEAGSNPFALQAFETNQNGTQTSLADIQYWTSPALPGTTDTTRRWTIIAFHSVDNGADSDSVSSELLQSMVDYFIAKKIRVVSMTEGLNILGLNGQTFNGNAVPAVRPNRASTSRN